MLAEHLAERRFADGDAPNAAVAILRVGR
jgi:hypothetical protein